MILQTIFCKHQCLRSHNINFNFYLQKTPKKQILFVAQILLWQNLGAPSLINVINVSFNIICTLSIKIYHMHITDFLLL